MATRKGKTARERHPGNPWGLTPGESQVMDAICDTGCQKLAARKLGISVKTVEQHAMAAGRKIGVGGQLLKYLVWDRWRADNPPAATPPPPEG